MCRVVSAFPGEVRGDFTCGAPRAVVRCMVSALIPDVYRSFDFNWIVNGSSDALAYVMDCRRHRAGRGRGDRRRDASVGPIHHGSAREQALPRRHGKTVSARLGDHASA